jgi:hypothetical protein
LLVLFVLGVSVSAQNSKDTTYKLTLSIGAGFSRNLTVNQYIPPGSTLERGGFGFSARAEWQAEHLLAIGVESGFLRISSLTLAPDSLNDAQVSLNALPLLLVFSMKKSGVEFSAGIGYYRYSVVTELKKTGFRGGSSSFELGYMLSGAYVCSLSERLETGLEVKWHSITERSVSSVLVLARLNWRIVVY